MTFDTKRRIFQEVSVFFVAVIPFGAIMQHICI